MYVCQQWNGTELYALKNSLHALQIDLSLSDRKLEVEQLLSNASKAEVWLNGTCLGVRYENHKAASGVLDRCPLIQFLIRLYEIDLK